MCSLLFRTIHVWRPRRDQRESLPPSTQAVALRPYHTQSEASRGRNWLLGAAWVLSCVTYGFAYAYLVPHLMPLLAVPVAMLAALAIWALPDTESAPTNLIESLLFAYFVALIMWPNYLAIALPGLPWITLLRLVGFPLAGLTLISVSMSANFRSDLAKILISAGPVWKMLALFIAIQTITIAFSRQVADSIQMIIVSQLNWTLIFFVSCYVFNRRGRALLWSYLVWGMAIAVSIIGVLEHYEGHLPWAGHIPSFLRVNADFLRLILNGGSRAGSHRVQATFGTSLGLAEYLALSAPFVIHFAIAGSRPFVRIAAVATLPLSLSVILVTESRLGVIGLFLGSLVYLLFWAGLRWRRNRASFFGPAIALTYPVIFILALASTLFVHRLSAVVWGNGPQNDSNAGRAEEWRMAGSRFLENPLGHGGGTSAVVLGFVQPDGRLTIDSNYLSVVLDYGVLGLILYYGSIVYSIYLSAKCVLSVKTTDVEQNLLVPIATSLAVFLFTSSVLSETDNHPIIFMLMGMAVALVHRSRQSNGATAAAPL
jgi:hypothetical protein